MVTRTRVASPTNEFSRSVAFTHSFWSVASTDLLTPSNTLNRTRHLFQTARFSATSPAFFPSLAFARTAALRRSPYPELDSIWGYLAACIALLVLGSALLLRGLVLLQRLGAGLEIQDSDNSNDSVYSDEESGDYISNAS
jgi:hypothetical protein